jgi:hypothetical protein
MVLYTTEPYVSDLPSADQPKRGLTKDKPKLSGYFEEAEGERERLLRKSESAKKIPETVFNFTGKYIEYLGEEYGKLLRCTAFELEGGGRMSLLTGSDAERQVRAAVAKGPVSRRLDVVDHPRHSITNYVFLGK